MWCGTVLLELYLAEAGWENTTLIWAATPQMIPSCGEHIVGEIAGLEMTFGKNMIKL